jgi:protein TonB
MPPRKALLAVGFAFAAGLLLFLALWLDQRDNNSFYRTREAPRSVAGQVFEPLPVPLPAGDDNASSMGEDGPSPAGAPLRRDQPPAPAPASPVPPVATPVDPASAIADRSIPQPVSSPAPRYPRDAQRRGESGNVLLRVHVGSDGEPTTVDLVQGSGSRSLDRAAVDAVRRWHFAPAIRNGQPVEGVVQVPVTFNLGP